MRPKSFVAAALIALSVIAAALAVTQLALHGQGQRLIALPSYERLLEGAFYLLGLAITALLWPVRDRR